MQNWDRIVLLLLGAGTAIYAGVAGRQSWKAKHRLAAVSDFLLALVTVGVPVGYAILMG